MSTTKRPSHAAMLRKIERLEAQIAELRELMKRVNHIDYEKAMQYADMRVRHEQALRILQGEDE